MDGLPSLDDVLPPSPPPSNEAIYLFMEFTFRQEKLGRVILLADPPRAPKTVENFRCLCTGECGVGVSGRPLHYKGTRIHKLVGSILVQGGDITDHNGTGGDTIYGRTFVEVVEDKQLKFMNSGILGLAYDLDAPTRRGSQFFITCDMCPHLEKTCLSFGKVLKGIGIIRELSNVDCVRGIPSEPIIISDCGQLSPGEDWKYCENDGTADIYPFTPVDWEFPPYANKFDLVREAATIIRDVGNKLYLQGLYYKASRKYFKSIRFFDWAKENNNYMEIDPDQYTACILNLAACHLKMGFHYQCMLDCTKVLKRDPNVVKAYYRRGQARYHLREYQLAMEDLRTAYRLYPHASIAYEIQRMDNAIRTYAPKEKLPVVYLTPPF